MFTDMKCWMLAVAALCAVAMAANPAKSATLGATLTIDGGEKQRPGTLNVPLITLQNTSSVDEIIGFSLSIGDGAFNFDGVINILPPPGGTVSLDEGDTGIIGTDGVTTDRISFSFGGFGLGESVSFGVDIDRDTGPVGVDFRDVLFGANGQPVAEATVSFSRLGAAPMVLALDPGQPFGPNGDQRIFSFAAIDGGGTTDTMVPTPLPAPWLLLGAALAGMGFLGNKRGRG